MKKFIRKSFISLLSILFFFVISFISIKLVNIEFANLNIKYARIHSLLLTINPLIMLLWLLIGPIYAEIIFGISLILIFLIAIGLKTSCFLLHVLILTINIIILNYFYNKYIEKKNKAKLKLEDLEEQKNTILNQYNKQNEMSKAFNKKKYRYSMLKNFIEVLSSTLDINELSEHIIEKTLNLIEKSNMCILYGIDEVKLELSLLSSKSDKGKIHIKEKQGDIFDQWVFRHRQPINIYDINKDFRFSAKDIENVKRDFKSIISVPLITENRIVGTLRLDSKNAGVYTSDDLRLLDIIADLSATAIENALLYNRTEQLAIKDDLTELFVRRYFYQSLNKQFSIASRYNKEITVLLIDIDHFKQYNDTYGHTAGDIVLKEVAKILIEETGPNGVVARFGGEEFIILLSDLYKPSAIKKAENIRKRIQDYSIILRRKKTGITISIGVANYPNDTNLKNELINQADINLYKAKTAGRNKVCYS